MSNRKDGLPELPEPAGYAHVRGAGLNTDDVGWIFDIAKEQNDPDSARYSENQMRAYANQAVSDALARNGTTGEGQ